MIKQLEMFEGSLGGFTYGNGPEARLAQVRLEKIPWKCPKCGGTVRLAHPWFTLVNNRDGFFEVRCPGCNEAYRIYCQKGEVGWDPGEQTFEYEYRERDDNFRWHPIRI